MELQSDDMLPYLKGLVFTYRVFCKADSSGGKVECLTVPVKNNAFFRKAERIRNTWRGFDLKPPDLFLSISINARSECTGNELSPKANTDDRNTQFNCGTNKLFFRSKPWQGLLVINAHGASHHYNEIELICLWQGSMNLEKTGVAYIGTVFVQPQSHTANAFERHMLKYVNFHSFSSAIKQYKLSSTGHLGIFT